MTLRQLGQEMDAPEFMEWMAYYMIKDEKEVTRLNNQIASEKDVLYHQQQMRSFFQNLTKRKK
jgi:hypothetical protein